MTTTLVSVDPLTLLAGVALAASGLGVIALCWRRRAVLAGFPALAGTALAGLAIGRELTGGAPGVVLLGAFAALLIAIALIGIGSVLWRLLESPSDVERPSADRDRRP